MKSTIARERIPRALALLLVLPLIWPLSAQSAGTGVFQLTLSMSSGQTRLNGGPPSLPGSITISGVANTANEVDIPPMFPRPAIIHLPLDQLFFSGPGVSGEYVNPGEILIQFLTPHSNSLSMGGTGVGGDPGLFGWLSNPPEPYQFFGFVDVGSSGQTFLLTSGNTVSYTYSSGFAPVFLSVAVPEPTTLALWLGSLIGAGVVHRRLRSTRQQGKG